MLTALVQIEHDGDRLTEDELISVVGFLMFAGFETTGGLLSTSIVALFQKS